MVFSAAPFIKRTGGRAITLMTAGAVLGLSVVWSLQVSRVSTAMPVRAAQASQGQLTSPAALAADAAAVTGQVVTFNPVAPNSAGFVHPGIYTDQSQLSMVKAKVAAGEQPWLAAYNKVQTSYGSLTYTPHPVPYVECGPALDTGCTSERNDAMRAFNLALLWYYSGDQAYAAKAIQILNAWSPVIITHRWDGTSTYNGGKLNAGWSGTNFIRAAEILRYSNAGWAAGDIASFEAMLKRAFLPLMIDGWTGGGWNTLTVLADTTMSIGVFTNDRDIFDNGVGDWRRIVASHIYLTADGAKPVVPAELTGANKNPNIYWNNAPNFTDGQTQESCRDIGHVAMGLASALYSAETARLQNVDLYGEQKTRLSAALEFEAQAVAYREAKDANPAFVIPAEVCGGTVNWGGDAVKFTGDVGLNEFAGRLGMAMPNLTQFVAKYRLIPSSGNNLHMQSETLTHGRVMPTAACADSDGRLGAVTVTVHAPLDATYRIWSRVKPTAAGAASYALQVDGGCPLLVGGSLLPDSAWTWVDYRDGNPAAKVELPLTAGPHTFVLRGATAGLAVDTVMLANDVSCVPIDGGGNCEAGPADTTAPDTVLTSPMVDTLVSGTVNLGATASDNKAVTKVQFLKDGVVLGESVAVPYAWSWDTTTVANGVYALQSKAYDAAGNSSVSAIVYATVLNTDTTAPSAPLDLVSPQQAASSISLRWTAATDNVGVTGYNLYRDGVLVGSPVDTTFTDNGLAPATSYRYTLVATDAAGNNSAPTELTVATMEPPDVLAPTTPQRVTAVAASASRVVLTWDAATDNKGVDHYVIWRNGAALASVAAPATAYTDMGLADATTYRYTVRAVDIAGNMSADSAAASITLPDGTAPAAPANLTGAVVSPTQITLSWSATTDNVGVTGYKLSRNGVLLTTPATALTYANTGLQPGTAYSYSLAAVDAAGNASAVKTLAISTPLESAAYGAGFAAQYFNNKTLSGQPFGRLDSTLAFDWGAGSPMTGIATDNFSARWTGQIKSTTSGMHTFYTQTDDGVRLWVNDTLLIDQWSGPSSTRSATFALTAGVSYNIRVEYFEATGMAFAQLLWKLPNSSAKVAVPSSAVVSGAAGLSAAYFANATLTGPAAFTRLDTTVNFNWGTTTPDARMAADNYSVRWTGKVKPATSGAYKFYTDSDNSVRLWVNGQLIIDNWTAHTVKTDTSAAITLVAGTLYDIKMEYREQTGPAVAKLSWSFGSTGKTIMPATALRDR